MIRKAIIPAAGLGTRLLSATKEQPKEMLPLFARDDDGLLCLKPMVQQIFEQLFDLGVREFYFIVGKGKRAIEDHFTPDREFVERLNGCGRESQARELDRFYKRIEVSTIAWVNQSRPRGFGDAVLQVERLIGDQSFLVHAGDTYLISETHCIPLLLSEMHGRRQAEATLALKEVEDPQQYGVAEVRGAGNDSVEILRVVEKPSEPMTNLAIMAVYVFNPTIFDAVRNTPAGKGNEIQLTDAIQTLINTKHNVQGIRLGRSDIYLDIGTSETYWQALQTSYYRASSKKHQSE